jgi:indolepyruvate ferredoxin oxidoreductase
VSDDNKLATAIAKSYFRLLSYKDEYEVARLHTDENFLASLRRDYGDRAKLRFHLAPPILNGKNFAAPPSIFSVTRPSGVWSDS